MSAIANVTAFDGASTPVSHTLVPLSVTRDGDSVVAEWAEQLAGLPMEAQVRLRMTRTSMKNGIVRTSTRVEVPVMEAIGAQNAAGYTAAPKVAFVDTVELVSYAHPRSTITSRRLARQLAVNIANGIATTVSPVTTGPAPELVDGLISPT